jgi:hypothetical protein
LPSGASHKACDLTRQNAQGIPNLLRGNAPIIRARAGRGLCPGWMGIVGGRQSQLRMSERLGFIDEIILAPGTEARFTIVAADCPIWNWQAG